jgi:hypothetical protein
VSASRAFNLIHSSDDPISTLREWGLFTPVAKIRSILARVASAGWTSVECSPRVWWALALSGVPQTDANFARGLLRIVGRAADLAALDVPALAGVADGAVDLLVQDNPGVGPSEQIRWAVAGLGELRVRLQAAMDGAPADRTVQALEALLSFPTGGRQVFEDSVAHFEVRGLRVCDWDRWMVVSNLHQPDDLEYALSESGLGR